MLGPWVQPFASAANFFVTFPILPYKMGAGTAERVRCTPWATTGRAIVRRTCSIRCR